MKWRDIMDWPPKPAPLMEDGTRYATFSERIFASALDTALTLFLFAPLFAWLAIYVYGDLNPEGRIGMIHTPEQLNAFMQWAANSGFYQRWMLNNLLQIAIMGVVICLFWNFFLATPGKMLLKMKILDETTLQSPSTKQWIIRYLGYIPATLPLMLGLVWILFDKKNQGWHDKMARTVVVKKPWFRIRRKKDISSTHQSADPSDSPAPASTE